MCSRSACRSVADHFPWFARSFPTNYKFAVSINLCARCGHASGALKFLRAFVYLSLCAVLVATFPWEELSVRLLTARTRDITTKVLHTFWQPKILLYLGSKHPDLQTTEQRSLTNNALMTSLMEKQLIKRTTAEWIILLRKSDMICSEINDIRQVRHYM
jgi:hypothetical protein